MPADDAHEDFLPDFCSAGGVLPVLLIAELVALALALAGLADADSFWRAFLLLSIYLQWLGVCSAGVLCVIRRHAVGTPPRRLLAYCYAALMLTLLLIAEVTYSAGRYTVIAPLVEGNGHAGFLVSNLGIGAVVAALGLRYFWLRAEWRRRAASEMAARYQALQARIRPHFLFNALNGIAELVATRPEAAERGLEDLAALLRATLQDDERHTTRLSDELALARAYVAIEALRLGERLRVDWDIDPAVADWPVPPLCLQPLVENAIAHGVAQIPEGGRVTVRAAAQGARLALSVVNPLPSVPGEAGRRLALDNIEQRLALRYGDRARLSRQIAADVFRVELSLPRTDGEAV